MKLKQNPTTLVTVLLYLGIAYYKIKNYNKTKDIFAKQ